MPAQVAIKMILQYDGSGFHGYQRQKGGIRTVQQTLEESLSALLGERVPVTGASRTDAGVHAFGQVVSFSAETAIPPERMARALWQHLPYDLSAVSSEQAPEGFNARFNAHSKTYVYLCYPAERPNPIYRNHALCAPRKFDPELAKAALERFTGTHDFTAFENRGSSPQNPVKTIHSFSLDEWPPFLRFTVTGSGFLYKMVRNMVSSAIEAGLEKLEPDDISEALESGKRCAPCPTIPPQGLYLMRVRYED